MNRSLRSEGGQAVVLTLVFMTAMLGMAALVIDVGSWFRAQRDTQRVADAAALAGAQALPESTGQARSFAIEYTNKNPIIGTPGTPTITFPASSTIKVHVSKPVNGFFSKIFGIDSFNVGADAAARAMKPGKARWAAPIGVDIKHPLLQCKPLPCFNQDTVLDLEKTGPGAFRLINLDGSKGGTSPGILADWLLKGFDGWMPLDWYFSDPGAKFNSSHIQDALTKRIGTEMLFPIYDQTKGQGANFEYHVIGWVGFVITSFDARGNSGKLYGHFVRVIWEGIQSESGEPDFGVRSIELIE
jgi:putative Flp pilus-assembly TadE/G-like protein